MMDRVVIVASTIMPVGPTLRYGGTERLAYEFAGAVAHRGYEVAVICCDGSVLPRGVTRLETGPPTDFDEPGIGGVLSSSIRFGDAFIDLSHSHQAGWMPNAPHLTPIWHDPLLLVPPPAQPLSNIVCLSNWQRRRFSGVYHQEARVLSPICADPDFFRPGAEISQRLVFLGKMDPLKGALRAVRACREAKLQLDIIGGPGPGDPSDYAEAVRSECDARDIVYRGEVDHAAKRQLLQGARALFYPINYPAGFGESHSHKMVEAMLCGTPCIAIDRGDAMREVIDEGETGYLIEHDSQLGDALRLSDELDRSTVRARAVERFATVSVVERWMELLGRVHEGERW